MIIDLESDNKDVNEMVLAAKCDNWGKVSEILNTKPYLINCIPEERAWAALHQAVYWNNSTVVANLLSYTTCDATVKSKPCLDEMIAPSSTPKDLAEQRRYEDIARLLTENISKHRQDRFGKVLYFVSRQEGQTIAEMGFPLLVLEVVMYKNSLLGPAKNVQDHSVDMMKQIFEDESHNWPKIEDNLYKSLYGHCRASAQEIRKAHAKDEASFFREIIRLYTSNLVYKDVNEALAREFNDGFRPAAADLALGLYALLLDITLSFWEDLPKSEAKTYRGIPTNEVDKYTPGDNIMFTTIVSCSLFRNRAEPFAGSEGTLFIFDNSTESSKRPRYIKPYSHLPEEEECVYILGTSFKVDAVNGNTVKLSLL